jgi:hypothetical protein
MLDLRVDLLRLEVLNPRGHEHRLGAIAERAAAIFAREAAGRWAESGIRREVETVTGGKVDIDLNTTGDENAARAIAAAWLDSLALKLRT